MVKNYFYALMMLTLAQHALLKSADLSLDEPVSMDTSGIPREFVKAKRKGNKIVSFQNEAQPQLPLQEMPANSIPTTTTSSTSQNSTLSSELNNEENDDFIMHSKYPVGPGNRLAQKNPNSTLYSDSTASSNSPASTTSTLPSILSTASIEIQQKIEQDELLKKLVHQEFWLQWEIRARETELTILQNMTPIHMTPIREILEKIQTYLDRLDQIKGDKESIGELAECRNKFFAFTPAQVTLARQKMKADRNKMIADRLPIAARESAAKAARQKQLEVGRSTQIQQEKKESKDNSKKQHVPMR